MEGIVQRVGLVRGANPTLVATDAATCADCPRELADRRYRFSFVNCTNCGPRFTIARDVPFTMCSLCSNGRRGCGSVR